MNATTFAAVVSTLAIISCGEKTPSAAANERNDPRAPARAEIDGWIAALGTLEEATDGEARDVKKCRAIEATLRENLAFLRATLDRDDLDLYRVEDRVELRDGRQIYVAIKAGEIDFDFDGHSSELTLTESKLALSLAADDADDVDRYGADREGDALVGAFLHLHAEAATKIDLTKEAGRCVAMPSKR